MLQRYWKMYVDFKVAEYYYQAYANHSKKRKTITSITCTLASAACIVAWSEAGVFHMFWAGIIMISQFISVLQPFFPYDKRLTAARYIHADVRALCTDVSIVWDTFTQETPDDIIGNQIAAFTKRYDEIESRFATVDTFPPKMDLHSKAESDAQQYFRRYMT